MPVNNVHTVLKTALAAPAPCPRCQSTNPCRCMVTTDEKLDIRVEMITQHLEAAGLLPAREIDTGEKAAEGMARWLANESQHPRYGGDDGWKKLLDPNSENNIHHAHAKALEAHPRADRELEQILGRVRDQLLQRVRERRAAESAT